MPRITPVDPATAQELLNTVRGSLGATPNVDFPVDEPDVHAVASS